MKDLPAMEIRSGRRTAHGSIGGKRNEEMKVQRGI
jgi:hypothetical protein